MTELILVRHAATGVDPSRHSREWDLNEEGTQQATELVNMITGRNIEIDQLHCSAEPKTSQTLQSLAATLDLVPRKHTAFNEIHLPEYVKDRDQWLTIKEKQLTDPQFQNDGETSQEALERFLSGLAELDHQKTHLVCTHGTVMSLFIAKMRGYLWEQATFTYWQQLGFAAIEVMERPD